jgi:hypothetical protein
MKCEICWKKYDHAEFRIDGWVNVCTWCCGDKKEHLGQHKLLNTWNNYEFDPLFSW